MRTISLEIAGVCDKSNTLIRFSTENETGDGFRCYPRSLCDISSFSSTLDQETNLTQSGEITAKICCDIGNAATGELQPFEIFGAFSADALDESFVLSRSLNSSDDVLAVVGPNVNISNSLIHIGTEAILLGSKYDSTETEALFNVTSRGYAGTLAQSHTVDATIGFSPDIARNPFAWLGRLVRVYLDGALWRVCIMTGSPLFSDGMISLSFVGIENRLTDIPGSVVSPFKNYLSDSHAIKPQKMAGYIIRMKDRSPVYSGKHERPSRMYFNNTKLNGLSSQAEQIASVIFNAANTPVGAMLSGSSITRPRVVIDGQTVQTNSFTYVSGSECTLYHASCGFIGPSYSGSGSNLFDCSFYFLPEARIYTYRFGTDTEIEGGESVANLIRATSARSVNYPVSLSNAEPLFNLNSVIAQDGWVCKSPLSGGWEFQLGIVQRYQKSKEDQGSSQKTLYSQLLSDQPDLNITQNKSYNINAGPDVYLPKETAESALVSYPIRLNCQPDSVTRVVGRYNIGEILWINLNSEKNAQTKIPLLYADRWWELGDVLTVVNKFPGRNQQYIRVTWTEPDGKERECRCLVYFVSRETETKYKYKCDSNCVGFGDWPGFDRCVLSQIISTNSSSDNGFLIPFITSVDGMQKNGEFDVLPSGLGILSDLIDQASFNSFANMAGVKAWDVEINEETDVEAIISTMLLSTLSTITPGFDETVEKFDISRTWIGYPTRKQLEDSEKITDDDIVGIPSSSIDPSVVTSYEMLLPNDNKITWHDIDSEQRYGIGSSMTLDFTSAKFNQSQGAGLLDALRGSIGAFCEYYGTQKRKWLIRIPFEKAKNYRVGQVVSVSSKYLSGYTMGIGVESSAGTITAVTLDPKNGTADLEIWARKRTCGGYSHSVLIKGITYTSRTTATCVCLRNALSDDDFSYFGQNDEVYLTAFVSSTDPWVITSIDENNNKITLSTSVSKSRSIWHNENASFVGLIEPKNTNIVPFFLLGVDRFA